MLYNPTWSKEPTLASFSLWLETKDPDEAYNYLESRHCAVGQWLTAIGEQPKDLVWDGDVGIANGIAALKPRTFGALRKRLEEYERIHAYPVASHDG